MKELVTVFENEEAARLLNYFIFYKEIVNKTENRQITPVDDDGLAVLPKVKG